MSYDRKCLTREIFQKLLLQSSQSSQSQCQTTGGNYKDTNSNRNSYRNINRNTNKTNNCINTNTNANAIPLWLLLEYYDATTYPSVNSGIITPEQCTSQMIDMFECNGSGSGSSGSGSGSSNMNNLITYESFISYYKGIGMALKSTIEFDNIIRNTWCIHDNSRLKQTQIEPEHAYDRAGALAYRMSIPKAPSQSEFYKPENIRARDKYEKYQNNTNNSNKNSNSMSNGNSSSDINNNSVDTYPYKKRVIITHRDGSEEVIEYNFNEEGQYGRDGRDFQNSRDGFGRDFSKRNDKFSGRDDDCPTMSKNTMLMKNTQNKIIQHLQDEMGIYDIINVRI